MITGKSKKVTLYKISEEQLDFGIGEKEEIIAKIDMTIFETAVSDFSASDIKGLKYEYMGLTAYSKAESGMYIQSCGTKYKINYVAHLKKYSIVYMERVI